jgi:hypothetical protein
MTLDLAGVTGAELGEVLVHGYDIAKATGRPWPIAAHDARLALRAALRLTSAYINPDTAHGHIGGYDLRIWGGPRVVIRFTTGARRLSSQETRRSTATSWPRRWRCSLSYTDASPSGGRSARASCSRGAVGHGGPWASSNYSSTSNRYLRPDETWLSQGMRCRPVNWWFVGALGAGDGNRTRTISLGIRPIGASTRPGLGSRCTGSDREAPSGTGVNGPLMAQGPIAFGHESGPMLDAHACSCSAAALVSGLAGSVVWFLSGGAVPGG